MGKTNEIEIEIVLLLLPNKTKITSILQSKTKQNKAKQQRANQEVKKKKTKTKKNWVAVSL